MISCQVVSEESLLNGMHQNAMKLLTFERKCYNIVARMLTY